jgi:hypothetical protein
VLVVIGVLTGCSLRPTRTHHSSPARTSTRPAPAHSTAFTNPETLLPVSRADLTAAIQRATQAATAYLTYRYDETPAAYLTRLQPLVTPELYATLARTAATPGIHARRNRDHEVATADAAPTRIRTIGTSSLVLLVTAVRDITTVSGRRAQTDELAVTAIKETDGTWLVADIEPAAAGDNGDTSDAGTS